MVDVVEEEVDVAEDIEEDDEELVRLQLDHMKQVSLGDIG